MQKMLTFYQVLTFTRVLSHTLAHIQTRTHTYILTSTHTQHTSVRPAPPAHNQNTHHTQFPHLAVISHDNQQGMLVGAPRVGLSIQPPCMSAHVCCILSSCADVFLRGWALRVGLSIQPPCMSTCVYTCTLYYAAVLTSYVYNNGNA